MHPFPAVGGRFNRRNDSKLVSCTPVFSCYFAVLLGVACFAPLCMVLGSVQGSVVLTLALFSLLAFVCTTWLFTLTALLADTAPPAALATVHGISGAFGALGALVFNAGIGSVVDRFGYAPVFIVAGGLHLAAAGVLKWSLIRHAARVP